MRTFISSHFCFFFNKLKPLIKNKIIYIKIKELSPVKGELDWGTSSSKISTKLLLFALFIFELVAFTIVSDSWFLLDFISGCSCDSVS